MSWHTSRSTIHSIKTSRQAEDEQQICSENPSRESESKVIPVFQKPAICRGTQRIGEIWGIKPATRLPVASLTACWMEGMEASRELEERACDGRGWVSRLAAKRPSPGLPKAAARSYGTCVSHGLCTFEPFRRSLPPE